jgi:hypothetical protein
MTNPQEPSAGVLTWQVLQMSLGGGSTGALAKISQSGFGHGRPHVGVFLDGSDLLTLIFSTPSRVHLAEERDSVLVTTHLELEVSVVPFLVIPSSEFVPRHQRSVTL